MLNVILLVSCIPFYKMLRLKINSNVFKIVNYIPNFYVVKEKFDYKGHLQKMSIISFSHTHSGHDLL